MHITLLAPSSHPVGEPYASVLQMHVHLLARGLAARGHRVRLIAPVGSADDIKLLAYPAQPEAGGGAEAEFWRDHFAYAAAMQSLADDPPEVLHIHAAHPLPLAMAALMRLPQVVTLHGAAEGPFVTAVRTQRAPGGQIKYAALSATQARRWRPHVRQCSILAPGVDLSRWRYSDAPEEGSALWCGRLHRRSGAIQAIEAAHQSGMRIRLAGKALRKSYVKQEILPRLREGDAWLGEVKPSRLAEELGRAAVFIYTPRGEEASAVGAARALACGTPVAAFHSPAAAELLTAESGCLAPPGDAASLAATIEIARAFSREDCRRRATVYCDPARMLLQHEALYRRAISDRTPDPSRFTENIAA